MINKELENIKSMPKNKQTYLFTLPNGNLVFNDKSLLIYNDHLILIEKYDITGYDILFSCFKNDYIFMFCWKSLVLLIFSFKKRCIIFKEKIYDFIESMFILNDHLFISYCKKDTYRGY